MELKKIFTSLFLEFKYGSVIVRLALTLLIILHFILQNEIIEKLILVFYILLIISIVLPLMAVVGNTLGYKNEFIKNEINFLKSYPLNFIYKIVLLIYILLFIKSKITKEIIIISILFILGYYLTNDIKNLYKTTFKLELLLIILSILLIIGLEKVRFNK
jgi:hypothetical protein